MADRPTGGAQPIHHNNMDIKAAAFFAALFFLIVFCLVNYFLHNPFNLKSIFSLFAILFSLVLVVQGVFTLTWMLYAWNNPQQVKKHQSPRKYSKPNFSFTAIIPARHEEKVIYDTIMAVSDIDYPDELKEVLVVCRQDDYGTISVALKAIRKLENLNVSLLVFDGTPINKPHGLNIGLRNAKNEVVVVFDAEDEPHREIYNIVNTIMQRDGADVVQSGVQLMNFQKPWFSTLNVLEYFLWYKSALLFYSRFQALTLGGNTVFFKKRLLEQVGGWDENNLTEDADIGVRMSVAGAKIVVVYDSKHATREETPPDMASFVRQRTRWNHGFLQVISKGDWSRLQKRSQKLLLLYILSWPILQTIFVILGPLLLVTGFSANLPVYVALIMNLPTIVLLLQISVLGTALSEFAKEYELEYPLSSPLKILVAYFPYQILLAFGVARALYRVVLNNTEWEKTDHIGAHRNQDFSSDKLDNTDSYAKPS